MSQDTPGVSCANNGERLMPSRQLVVRLCSPLALSVVEGLAKNTYQKLLDEIAGIYDRALKDACLRGRTNL